MEAEAFNELVEQKLEPDMITNIKTIFEIAEEKAEQRGEQRGEQIGLIKKARIGVINMLKLHTFSIEQIADILDVEADFVKKIQAELVENPNIKA